VIIDAGSPTSARPGFLDGTLIVPQFVLRELQYIADSQDSLKRNRGRKGWTSCNASRRGPDIKVVISEAEFPEIKDVRHEAHRAGQQLGGKIITNDFNLKRWPSCGRPGPQHQLPRHSSSRRAPGESMKVFILKEGKEAIRGSGTWTTAPCRGRHTPSGT